MDHRASDALNILIWEGNLTNQNLVAQLETVAASFEDTGKGSEISKAAQLLMTSLIQSSDNIIEKGSYTVGLPLPVRVRVATTTAKVGGYLTVKPTNTPMSGWSLGTYMCPGRCWLILSNPTWRLEQDNMKQKERGTCTARLSVSCLEPIVGGQMTPTQEVLWDRRFEANQCWDKFVQKTLGRLIGALNPPSSSSSSS